MDSAEFLDLLGNANRRRILQLLARKPCYVTEISEFLGVSPKAVIDHLRKLEDAGLVESRTDDRRRKYFSIARHIRLEVTVSPYEFGTKSAYPASTRLDITSCRRLNIDLDDGSISNDEFGADTADEGSPGQDGTAKVDAGHDTPDGDDGDGDEGTAGASSDDVITLVRKLRDFEQLESELSLAQRWTQGHITDLRDALATSLDDGDPRLISKILLALAERDRQVEELSRKIEAPPAIVEEVLEELAADGVVYRDGHRWCLDE